MGRILFLFAMLPVTCLALDRPVDVAEDRVDLIELNHLYDECGRHVFAQLIYWDYDEEVGGHYIVAWRLLKSPRQLPVKRDGEWVSTWMDGQVLRRITATTYDTTWEQHDPELEQRSVLPKEHRRGLLDVRIPTLAK